MPFRNIFIANTASLSTKNEQLIVDNGEIFSFPIEDIRCVLIEDYRSAVSVALISKFAEAGVTLIVCNEKHIPTAALNPINRYSRQLKQINSQIKASLPLKKQLWKQIVVSKIKNQAKCLEILQKSGSEKLLEYAKTVKSGDPSNVEGRAAAFYFKSLFGKDFRRDKETPLNAALNYGYALIRAVISRTVCLYGFEPSWGVHHCNELNNFNLSDDFIEPFRPFIDLTVAGSMFDYGEFGTADKSVLLKSLNASVMVEGKKASVYNAIETLIQSYSESIKSGVSGLVLPELIEIEFKKYE